MVSDDFLEATAEARKTLAAAEENMDLGGKTFKGISLQFNEHDIGIKQAAHNVLSREGYVFKNGVPHLDRTLHEAISSGRRAPCLVRG